MIDDRTKEQDANQAHASTAAILKSWLRHFNKAPFCDDAPARTLDVPVASARPDQLAAKLSTAPASIPLPSSSECVPKEAAAPDAPTNSVGDAAGQGIHAVAEDSYFDAGVETLSSRLLVRDPGMLEVQEITQMEVSPATQHPSKCPKRTLDETAMCTGVGSAARLYLPTSRLELAPLHTVSQEQNTPAKRSRQQQSDGADACTIQPPASPAKRACASADQSPACPAYAELAPVSDSSSISELAVAIGCGGGRVVQSLNARRFYEVGSLRMYVSLLGGSSEARMDKLQANLGLAPADAARVMTYLLRTGLPPGC